MSEQPESCPCCYCGVTVYGFAIDWWEDGEMNRTCSKSPSGYHDTVPIFMQERNK